MCCQCVTYCCCGREDGQIDKWTPLLGEYSLAPCKTNQRAMEMGTSCAPRLMSQTSGAAFCHWWDLSWTALCQCGIWAWLLAQRGQAHSGGNLTLFSCPQMEYNGVRKAECGTCKSREHPHVSCGEQAPLENWGSHLSARPVGWELESGD